MTPQAEEDAEHKRRAVEPFFVALWAIAEDLVDEEADVRNTQPSMPVDKDA